MSGGLGASGFFAGDFDVGKLLVSAAVGGFASKLGGGKFGNGALTGAFAYSVAHGANKLKEQRVASSFLDEKDIKKALKTDGVKEAHNVEVAEEIVNNFLDANPDALPYHIEGRLEFTYSHQRGIDANGNVIGAEHTIQFLRNPVDGEIIFTVPKDTVTMHAGSANSVNDAVKIILHEYGHHTYKAFNYQITGNPKLSEKASDSYARTINKRIQKIYK